ncbi:MAG TPA: protein kinase [Gemmata sp.]
MSVPPCPSAETLTAFARGDLSAEGLVEVADHIVGCAACGRALQLVPEDSLANLARAAAASPNTVHATRPPVPRGEPAVPAGDIPNGFADHPRYRILSKLGAGGMGTVYKAEDLWMGRVIAIKVVSPHLTAKAAAVERFRKEVRVAAQLNDPRMIIAHDTGEAGGCQFLVMELVDGYSLDRLVARRGPLAVPMACAFTRHAALGLQHAAEKGMVHRDIKPQNLMVTRKGQIKILDFGLARFAHAEAGADEAPRSAKVPFGAGRAVSSAGLTNPNMLMGTPDYLSPEQAKNSHDVDHRSDIYSLGCTLYFLLTGKPPFAGAPTLIDKLLAHTNDEPVSPCEERPEVPEELDAVLRRMMAKNPADRYQTGAEVASALLPFTRSDSAKEPVFEVVEAVVVTPGPHSSALGLRQTVSDTAPVAQQPTLAEAPRPKRPRKKKASWWKRRKRAVVRGAVAALVLITAAVIANVARKKLGEVIPDAPGTAKVNPPDAPPPARAATKGEKGEKTKDDKGTTAAPLVIAPPSKGVQVLFVLPSDGVWLDDFLPVRDYLTARGATVVTSSYAGGTSKPARGTPGPDVAIDVLLKPDMELSDYAAVLFCGERADEYMFSGRGSLAAAKVIQRMRDAGKPVGAICVGEGVLAAHGTLKGKRAAHSQVLFDKHPFLAWNRMRITWDKPGVVVDDKIVTASGAREANQFADAVLKLIDGK